MPQSLSPESNDDYTDQNPPDSFPSSHNSTIKPTAEVETVKEISFTERWKTNRFWLVRGSYHFLRTVWIIVMAIAGFIAWLISLLFI